MKTFIMIPTYNEVMHIEKLIDSIFKYVPETNILIVDDNSPDGTAKKVKEVAQSHEGRVFLLLRKKRKGRGTAGIDGFKYALRKGADVVVEMDADFSHHPRYLPKILKEIKNHDVVLGSRFVAGGKDKRGFTRRLITIIGNVYIKSVLGLSIRDCTSGYRAFKRKVLKKISLNRLISSGPSIVQEILYKADLFDYDIKEVPIIFVDRDRGISKFGFKIMLQGILMVLVLKFVLSDIWKEEVPLNA